MTDKQFVKVEVTSQGMPHMTIRNEADGTFNINLTSVNLTEEEIRETPAKMQEMIEKFFESIAKVGKENPVL